MPLSARVGREMSGIIAHSASNRVSVAQNGRKSRSFVHFAPTVLRAPGVYYPVTYYDTDISPNI